ncbi:FHA domain-containing protein [Xanthomonas sp. CFBP 8445]|uniref:FHA domain-containing protein n=1 Tax=Xanthomonas sp. CFBP 8445 TaxID=2971236 RepID=UPI0021DF9BAB|nr:FHA domain-containing protein [Xanthomonas sp. CFBP 8445]UYC13705.1 GAF domain-containing protein [Xanthomonas sp. CFBP 8445]
MPARLTAYLPDAPAPTLLLAAGQPLAIGRAADNALALEHPSVSRWHARLQPQADGHWQLHDLGSKNGSFRDGVRVAAPVALDTATWLRFGDIYAEFAPLSAADAELAERRQRARCDRATALTQELAQVGRLDDLLGASLDAVVELAQAERGVLVLADAHGQRIAASHGTGPLPLQHGLAGSEGALRRALQHGQTTVAHDIGGVPWLAERASVCAAGLRTMLCLPLRDGTRVLGAIYADSRRAGSAIGALDMELLEAFCERAALWIAARQALRETGAAPGPA